MSNSWTEEDSRDLDDQIKAMRAAERRDRSKYAPREKPPPTPRRVALPRRTASGRWLAKVKHKGVLHRQSFDTQWQAEQFIQQVKES